MAVTPEGDILTEANTEIIEALRREFVLQTRRDALAHINPLNPWKLDSFLQASMNTQRTFFQRYLTSKIAYTNAFRLAEGVTDAVPKFELPKFNERRAASTVATQMISPLQKKIVAAGLESVVPLPSSVTVNISPDRSRTTQPINMRAELDRLILAQSDIFANEAQRVVQAGSREYSLKAVEADPKCRGYARICDSSPCGFCKMLASRGPVYSSGKKFATHGKCGCDMEMIFEGHTYAPKDKAIIDEYFEERDKKVAEVKAAREAKEEAEKNGTTAPTVSKAKTATTIERKFTGKRLTGENIKVGNKQPSTLTLAQAKTNITQAQTADKIKKVTTRVSDAKLIKAPQSAVPTRSLLRWAELREPAGGIGSASMTAAREASALSAVRKRLDAAKVTGKGLATAEADSKWMAREVARRRTARVVVQAVEESGAL